MLFREDCTADELIDVISANRVYLPCLYVYNKIDQISIEEVDRIARQPNSVVVRYIKYSFDIELLVYFVNETKSWKIYIIFFD